MPRGLDIVEICALDKSASQAGILEGTRLLARALDSSHWAFFYSSAVDKATALGEIHKINDKAYYAAMHPVKLQAGKATAPNGELGRPAAADPVNTPELPGGRVFHTNV